MDGASGEMNVVGDSAEIVAKTVNRRQIEHPFAQRRRVNLEYRFSLQSTGFNLQGS